MKNKSYCKQNSSTKIHEDDAECGPELDPLIESKGTPTNRKRSGSQKMYQVVRSAMNYQGRATSDLPGDWTPSNSNHNLSSMPMRTEKSPKTKRYLWAISALSGKKLTYDENTNEKSAGSSIKPDDSPENQTDNCLMSDGPLWILKLATRGNLKSFSEFYRDNPNKLTTVDEKGATVVHHAVSQDRTQIIEFVLTQPGGIKLLDQADNSLLTPLHWSAIHNRPESTNFLLNMGANPSLLDKAGEAPIHTAIRCESIDVLNMFVKHKGIVDLNMQASNGYTGMHFAANVDNEEAAKILFENGAKPCISCKQGFKPIHEAALRGSKKVMELILQLCEKHGYTRAAMLSYSDKEHFSPLHCAVTGGNIDSIRMCLEYGARLDVRQDDDSTPMHMVCAQGAYEVVKLMFECSPEQAKATLSMTDKINHTPLHKAAMFDHKCIVRCLLEQGADTSAADKDLRTPLLLAASREAWRSMRILVEHSHDLKLTDKGGRNLLHTIVLNGGDIDHVNAQKYYAKQDFCECGECKNDVPDMSCWMKCDVKKMLNDTDDFGCTPLHYACKKGNLASLRTLMTLGVSAQTKSISKQSALHFAAMFGRYKACNRLINSPQGPNIINDKDDCGMTPLHLAALNGHLKVVQLFLNRGAVLHRNLNNETPLHVAASNGYTRTCRLLIEMNENLLNQVDVQGNTALHVASREGHTSLVTTLLDFDAKLLRNREGETCFSEAIKNQNRDVSLAIVQHARWEEAMQSFALNEENNEVKVPMLLLIQHMPDVCMAVLDRCIETADVDKKSKNYWVKYLFKYLQPNIDARDDIKRYMKTVLTERKLYNKESKLTKGELIKEFTTATALPALNKMVEFNRVDCLRHPVSTAYLRMKWNGYGRLFHSMNLFFYMCGLLPLTYLVCTIDSSNHVHPYTNDSNQTGYDREKFNRSITPTAYVMMIILTFMCICQIIKEIAQMAQQRTSYFAEFTNVVEWILYVSSLMYVIPFFTKHPIHWQFEMGAVAIFLAWFNLLLFLQRFDLSGIYVVMFLEILRTLIQVVLVFSFLIVAFGLAFYVLLQNEADHIYKEPLLSMLQVFAMTMGEVGYVERFLTPFVDDDPETLHFALPSMLLLAFFFIIMPILFMNLLIGLAVGDIAEIQSNAALQRLAMQVQLHTDIEGKLPTKVLRLVDHSELTFYPNSKCGSMWQKFFAAVSSRMQSNYGETSESTDHNMTYLQIEMHKQKQRIKSIQSSLDKQHDLLRLIVQKMEIRSEAEDQDEGWQPGGIGDSPSDHVGGIGPITTSKVMALRLMKSIKTNKY